MSYNGLFPFSDLVGEGGTSVASSAPEPLNRDVEMRNRFDRLVADFVFFGDFLPGDNDADALECRCLAGDCSGVAVPAVSSFEERIVYLLPRDLFRISFFSFFSGLLSRKKFNEITLLLRPRFDGEGDTAQLSLTACVSGCFLPRFSISPALSAFSSLPIVCPMAFTFTLEVATALAVEL